MGEVLEGFQGGSKGTLADVFQCYVEAGYSGGNTYAHGFHVTIHIWDW